MISELFLEDERLSSEDVLKYFVKLFIYDHHGIQEKRKGFTG